MRCSTRHRDACLSFIERCKRAVAACFLHVSKFSLEMWALLTLVFLSAISDFFMISVIIQYLSRDIGISDIDAGLLFGLFGALVTLCSLVCGMIIDNASIFVAATIALAIGTAGKAALAFATGPLVVMVALLVVVTISEALLKPAVITGLKRFSKCEETRAIACGFQYSVMNLGAVVAMISSDAIRLSVHAPNQGGVATNGTSAHIGRTYTMAESGRRLVMFASSLACAACFLVSLTACLLFVCCRGVGLGGRIFVASDGSRIESPRKGGLSIFQVLCPVDAAKKIVRMKMFWGFLALVAILTNVRALFHHLNSTFPKYAVRTFGQDFPYALVSSINPAMVILLTIPISIALVKVEAVKCIIAGSLICALSPMFMAIGDHPVFTVMFVVAFSIGEIMWSPVLCNYMLGMAPDGLEGIFSSLISLPDFASRIPVGLLSGFLLEKLCGSTCNGRLIWAIISGLALLSVVALVAMYPCFSNPGSAPTTNFDATRSDSEGDDHVDPLDFQLSNLSSGSSQ